MHRTASLIRVFAGRGHGLRLTSAPTRDTRDQHEGRGGTTLLYHDVQREPFAEASHFREAFFACLSARRDELFELADALLCADGPVTSPMDLTLLAEHRRGRCAVRRAQPRPHRRGAAAAGAGRAAPAPRGRRPARPGGGREQLAAARRGVQRGPPVLPHLRPGLGPAPDDPGLAVLVRRRAGGGPHLLVSAAGRRPARPRGRRRCSPLRRTSTRTPASAVAAASCSTSASPGEGASGDCSGTAPRSA